jgi:hypothetical protein
VVEADGVGLALIIELALELGLAEAEALVLIIALADAEVVALALAVAEALEVGLAIMLSSMPRSSTPMSSAFPAPIPVSSIPISSDWATVTGAKTNTASATDNTNKTNLGMFTPRFRVRQLYIRLFVLDGLRIGSRFGRESRDTRLGYPGPGHNGG